MTKKNLLSFLIVSFAAVIFALSYLPPWRRLMTAEPELDNGQILFSEGLLCVKKDGKWGYVNKNGREVIPVQFEWANPFGDNGITWVEINDEKKYINTRGRYVGELGWTQLSTPDQQEGSKLLAVREEHGTAVAYVTVDSFSENGLALFYLAGQYGFVNKSGEIVIPNQYNSALRFSENGFAAVKEAGKWGYIDSAGEFIIEPQFEGARPFGSSGLAAVMMDGQWGFINEKGKFVIKPVFDGFVAGYGTDGLALVYKDGRYCFVDLSGRVIYSLPEEILSVRYGYDGGTLGVGSTRTDWFIFDRRGRVLVEAERYSSFYDRQA